MDMKILNKYVLSGLLAVGLSCSASALNISPGGEVHNGSPSPPSQGNVEADAQAWVLANYDCSITQQYKQNVGDAGDSGNFASSYSTVFSPLGDESNATITYNGGSFITGEHIFLLVKDGNHDPVYYLFDLTAWNGTETLNLSGFWADVGGSISNVSIWTCPDGNGNAVPEGGTTFAMLGMAVGSLGFLKRKFLKS
jgi:hypothetical protein